SASSSPGTCCWCCVAASRPASGACRLPTCRGSAASGGSPGCAPGQQHPGCDEHRAADAEDERPPFLHGPQQTHLGVGEVAGPADLAGDRFEVRVEQQPLVVAVEGAECFTPL